MKQEEEESVPVAAVEKEKEVLIENEVVQPTADEKMES